MIQLLTLEKLLKLEYLALWKLWEHLAIDWTSLSNIHERLSAKHYKHDIEFRFWDFNDGSFEGVFSFICDCDDAIFKNPNRFVKSTLQIAYILCQIELNALKKITWAYIPSCKGKNELLQQFEDSGAITSPISFW